METIEQPSTKPETFIKFEKRPDILKAIEEIRTIKPEMVFNVRFGRHKTYEEGFALAEDVKKSDFLIFEAANWTPQMMDIYNAVSQGKRHPFLIDETRFRKGLLDAIHETKKPIKSIDYPYGHPNLIQLDQLYTYGKKKTLAADKVKESFSKATKIEDKREEYMFQQLPQTLKEFIAENPDLVEERKKNNEPLKVLLFLGDFHTRIYHALKEASPKSKRSFPDKSITFRGMNREDRKILFGKTAAFN
jgi:hypothetical protein